MASEEWRQQWIEAQSRHLKILRDALRPCRRSAATCPMKRVPRTGLVGYVGSKAAFDSDRNVWACSGQQNGVADLM